MSRVILGGIRRSPSEQEMKSAVKRAAEETTDFSWLNHGDAVFLKPALNSGVPYPATTHPIAIAAMVELLFVKGAGRVVVGDMSGIQDVKLSPKSVVGSTRRLMVASGMAQVAEAAGAELHFFEESGWNAFYEDWPIAGSHWTQGLMMPEILKEVDHIVLMPRCSRHVLTGSTLGLKAAVGYWRTDTRLEYHRDAATLPEKTAEGNTVQTLLQKQRLVISAADKILTTFGPNSGQIVQPDVGLIIASESVVAHDIVSLAWLLDNRRLADGGFLDRFIDHNRFVAEIGNRWIVKQLGGWTSALVAETLAKDDLNSIWNDRVLLCAFNVFGGRPQVTLHSDELVPDELRLRLVERITPPRTNPSHGDAVKPESAHLT